MRSITCVVLSLILFVGACSDNGGTGVNPVPRVTVTVVPALLRVGDSATLDVAIRGADGRLMNDATVTIVSTDATVARISGTTVHALTPGATYIRATSTAGTDSLRITVR